MGAVGEPARRIRLRRSLAVSSTPRQAEPVSTGAPASVPRRTGRSYLRFLQVGIPLLVGLVHVALVAPHYSVGSFDDDASYVLSARALLHGAVLGGYLPSGASVIGAYPPGFPALLAPVAWLWPHSFLALRLVSVVSFAALFPLTWWFLGRRRVGDGLRVAVLSLLALNPVLATYGSMVMAEAPFLVLVLVVLVAADRWDVDARTWGPAGVATVVGAAALVWMKEAGIGIGIGILAWLVLRRQLRKAAVLAAGLAALVVPIVVARLVAGVPVAGSRYSQELGSYYRGGLSGRLFHVVPSGLVHLLSTALPASVVPCGAPLPQHGTFETFSAVVAWQVPVLVVVGLVVWVVRHRDVVAPAVVAYLAMTLLWPFINERRVVLVLPVVVAWYALGAAEAGRAGLRAARWCARRARAGAPGAAEGRPRPRLPGAAMPRWGRPTLAVVAVVAVVVPLAVQMPRDYLFDVGQHSSKPGGSRYMGVLAALGPSSAVVETDYESTTALFSGHRTANSAFVASLSSCDAQAVTAALAADHAAYLLIGSLNKPDLIDSPCLLSLATTSPFAVRVLRTARDQASVFELVGPGTGHPDLVDALTSATMAGTGPVSFVPLAWQGPGDTPGDGLSVPLTGAGTDLTWTWPSARRLDQVSVGQVTGAGVSAVSLQVRTLDGTWRTVTSASGPVGDQPAAAPWLLARPDVAATGFRLVVRGDADAVVSDIAALGPAAGS